MAEDGLPFDWDQANIHHLWRHKVVPSEFEQVWRNEPLDLEYQTEDGEVRYKSLGATDQGRVLVIVWTVRAERVCAITAYVASRPLRRIHEKYGR